MAVLGFFAGSLYITDVSVGVDSLVHDSVPAFGEGGEIFVTVKDTVVDTPSHTIDKKCCTGGLLASEIAFIMETHIPETILTLTFHGCVKHRLEILDLYFAVRSVFRKFLKDLGESRYDPAVSA